MEVPDFEVYEFVPEFPADMISWPGAETSGLSMVAVGPRDEKDAIWSALFVAPTPMV